MRARFDTKFLEKTRLNQENVFRIRTDKSSPTCVSADFGNAIAQFLEAEVEPPHEPVF